MHFLYNLFLLPVALLGLPYYLLKMVFTGKYRRSLIPKLGGKQKQILAGLKGGPRVWIHAVSVGEVTAAAPIVASLKKMRPEAEVIFSTSTETGQEMAYGLVKEADAFIYFPLDLPFVVRKIIRLTRADVFAMVETELWPNFLRACRRHDMKTVMVNGRLSPRSYRKYKQTEFFWKSILSDVSAAGMISQIDAERLLSIGMDADKIQVLGNAKYDALAAMASPQLQEEIRRLFKTQERERFFVAGSTHQGEEEIVIEVYQELIKSYPDFKLILIPRHIERVKAVAERLRKWDLPDFITYAEMKNGRKRQNERVILVDVIGVLFKIYALATVVYCGGSLVPKGGQNILEPAAWGKMIFYGPSMEDFSTEAALLENAGAGMKVRNAAELLAGIKTVLQNPAEWEKKAAQGKAVVAANRGAADRYADLIVRHLPPAVSGRGFRAES